MNWEMKKTQLLWKFIAVLIFVQSFALSEVRKEINLNTPPNQSCSESSQFYSFLLRKSKINCANFVVNDPDIQLAVVACGDRLEESLANIKSAALLSRSRIKYHILADDDLREQFRKRIEAWPKSVHKKLDYQLYPITYPKDGHQKQWKKLFKPCASQRLFLPSVLSDKLDSIIYVDTDILFLSPVDDIWNFFNSFNSSQLSAMAPESESVRVGWYSRFARHPYYGATGLNSGVMLMNLTRFRTSKFQTDLQRKKMSWNDLLYPLLDKYKYNITWGDQCLLNIVFHYNPEMLYMFNCMWNYRPDHCMYGEMCQAAKLNGAKLLHGCRGVYHNEKMPVFKEVYHAFKNFSFEGAEVLLKTIKGIFNQATYSTCGKHANIFLNSLFNCT